VPFTAAAAKDCGMTWMTNHNKVSGCGWSANHATPVGHIRCQLSVATLLAASGAIISKHAIKCN